MEINQTDESLFWFSISLLFKSTIDQKHDVNSLWEESIILISALCMEDAIEKAKCFAKNKEHQYKNIKGQLCSWVFVDVSGCYQVMGELTNKSEIFSRFLRASEAKSLLTPFDK